MAVGTAMPMIDARERVTGTVLFTDNRDLPAGGLYGKIVRSPYAHARIVSIDTSAAEALPGVRAVVTGADLLATGRRIKLYYGVREPDQPVFAVDRVRYAGEAVAAVAADEPEIAAEAARLVEVEYEELPDVFGEEEALQVGAPLLHEAKGTNMFAHAKLRHGDIERGLAEADHIFEDVFTSPAAQHVPLEPHITIAEVTGDQVRVRTATQAPWVVHRVLAGIFGLAGEQVQVKVDTLGGGYGAKGQIRIEPQVACLAWKAGRPVKVVLDHAEVFVTVIKHAATVRIKTGVKADGTITARQVRVVYNAGAYADASPFLVNNGVVRALGPYRVPHAWVDAYGVYTNRPPAGAFRGAMTSQLTWAYEQQMDMIARSLGIDPLDIRLRNLLVEGDPFATGETMHDIHFKELLTKAAARIEWGMPSEQPPEPWKKRGKGLAIIMKSTLTPSRSEAKLRLDDTGQLHLLTSTVEMGQGARTALAQIAAEPLDLPVDRVVIHDPDTDHTPYDQTTSSSRSTFSMGNAIRLAVERLQARLRDLAAAALEARVEDLEFRSSQVAVRGAPDRSIPLADLLRQAGQSELLAEAAFETEGGLDPETSQGVASVHWHQGVGACEIEVDTETGKLRVLRYHSATYSGRTVNPMLIRLQNDGNVVMGLGPTLFEELVFDHGQVVNPNLSDYMIPAFEDIPDELTNDSLENPAGHGEFHGVGEMTLPPVGPAIGNALFDAVGLRLKELPLTPERVLKGLIAPDENTD